MAKVTDALIAATAFDLSLPGVTQDDYDHMPEHIDTCGSQGLGLRISPGVWPFWAPNRPVCVRLALLVRFGASGSVFHHLSGGVPTALLLRSDVGGDGHCRLLGRVLAGVHGEIVVVERGVIKGPYEFPQP